MSKENLGTDINGRVDFSLASPIRCDDIPLSDSVVNSVTAPAGFNRAFLSYAVGTNVWITFDGTVPAIPISNTVSTQELNPSVRQLSGSGTQVIKLISDSASYVNIRYDQGA